MPGRSKRLFEFSLAKRSNDALPSTLALDLPQRYLAQVRTLLLKHVPDREVWAYGSRVGGTGHEASDLDIVVRNPSALAEETPGLSALKEAFAESNLPICVDPMDWARIPESFHREIERAHIVVQEPRQ